MKIIRTVPYIDQTADWPNGCESVSTVMLLQYLGIPLSVKEFVDRFLDCGPRLQYASDGPELTRRVATGPALFTESTPEHCVLEGPDPNIQYVGDPSDEPGCFGIYAAGIMNSLKAVFGKYQANIPRYDVCSDAWTVTDCTAEPVNLTGQPMSALLHNYIDQDMPVIFWSTIDLKPMQEGPCWWITPKSSVSTGASPERNFISHFGFDQNSAPEETLSRHLFTWRSNEHCLLLVGYDDDKYYFNDPWHNHGCAAYDRTLVEQRHVEQYSMAVSIRPVQQ